jgi:hypothetical protein
MTPNCDGCESNLCKSDGEPPLAVGYFGTLGRASMSIDSDGQC